MVGIAAVASITAAAVHQSTSPFAPALTAQAVLRPRATTDYCDDYDALTSCTGAYESCVESVITATDIDYGAYSTCYCQFGIEYLSCYSSWIYTQACYSDYATYYSSDWWNTYYTEWFEGFCGTVPPQTPHDESPTSIPTIVNLSFEKVTIVTATEALPVPSYTNVPIYKGSGSLLDGACKSTEFTLLDVGSTVFYAPFVGCVSDRPDCCPYTVATTTLSVTQDTTVTLTVTATDASDGGAPQAIVAYPQPADQQVMKSCATDYYSISGNCCPKNYFPFTRALAGGTPCYSSLNRVATAPTLTAGIQGQPTDTSKPTSAVVNVVWAMSYPVSSSSPALSTGAIAGIAVGGAAAVGMVAFAATWIWRSKRKNKELAKTAGTSQPGPPPGGAPPPMMQHGQQPPMQTMGNLPPGSAYDPRASMATTAPSMLVPQQTGTPSVSELSTMSSGAALVGGQHHPQQGYFPGPHHGAHSPSFASSPSPGPNGMPVPPSIAEADEGMGGGYAYPPPQGGQPYYGQLPPGQTPPPGMVPMYNQGYGQPPMMQGSPPPQGMMYQGPPPPQGYPPQGYSPQQSPPQGYPPQQPPPQGYSPQGQPMYQQGPPPQGQPVYQQGPPPQEMGGPPTRATGELA